MNIFIKKVIIIICRKWELPSSPREGGDSHLNSCLAESLVTDYIFPTISITSGAFNKIFVIGHTMGWGRMCQIVGASEVNIFSVHISSSQFVLCFGSDLRDID